MFCGHCGKELPDDAKFCANCGNPVQVEQEEAPAPEAAPVPESVPAPEPVPAPVPAPAPAPEVKAEPKVEPQAEPAVSGKKRPKVLIGIIAAIVVLVLAVAAMAAGGGARGKVMKAAAKSVQAYSKAVDAMGLPSVDTFTKGAVSEELTVVLDRLPGDGYDDYYGGMEPVSKQLRGVGLKLATVADMKNQKIRIDLGLLLNDDKPAATALMYVDGDVIAVGSPELMDDIYLGVNTATLGEDLVQMLEYDDGFGDLSFNIFDVVEQMKKLSESADYDKDAEKALLKAIQVEEGDSREMRINGQSVKCAGYEVVIPADALVDYLLAQVEVIRSASTVEDMLAILEGMGLPVDELDIDEDMMSDTADDMEDGLDYLADELEDIEMDVYLSGGYVMAVLGKLEIDRDGLDFEFYFGGGKNYADNLSFEITDSNDEFELRFKSNGNHGGKGAFTDKSELTLENYGYTEWRLVSELSYEPGKDGENFSWRLREREWDGFDIKAKGNLTTGNDSLSLDLSTLSLTIDEETLSVELAYTIATAKGVQIPSAKPEMILTMTEDELYDLGEQIGESIAEFAEEIVDDYPLVEELMWYIY